MVNFVYTFASNEWKNRIGRGDSLDHEGLVRTIYFFVDAEINFFKRTIFFSPSGNVSDDFSPFHVKGKDRVIFFTL